MNPTVTELRDEMRNEIMAIRYNLRLWYAVSFANRSKWFGGSAALQDAAWLGLRTELCMGFRRVVPSQDNGGGGPDDHHLRHLINALMEEQGEQEGQEEGPRIAEALCRLNALEQSPAWCQLIATIDKQIACSAAHRLKGAPSSLSGLGPKEIDINQVLTPVAQEISAIYALLHPEMSSLDCPRCDPFLRQMCQYGLPGEDEEALDDAPIPDSETFLKISASDWDVITKNFTKPWSETEAACDLRMLFESMTGNFREINHTLYQSRWGWNKDDTLSFILKQSSLR